MTSRPSFTSSNKRPLSAIFLGSTNSSSTIIPDLPEPPSPGASSNDSGLPSPPATNSTGSGSVGDSNSNNEGSLRHKYSHSHSIMPNGSNHSRHTGPASALDDVQDENEIADDDEQTAKFGVGKRYSTPGPPVDNVSALERVKSLAKRNREALEKLTGMSRLNSASPAFGRSSVLSHSRSPLPSSSTNSSSSSSTRSHARVASQPTSTLRRTDTTRSGSETEREGHNVSPDERATTPPAYLPSRQRLVSAPDSPSRTRVRDRDNPASPRMRVSSQLSSVLSAEYDENDVTSAALAAVASSRRSPTTRKARQPLPQEFRDRERRGVDSQSARESTTPHHRNRSIKTIEATRSPSPSRASTSNSPLSPRSVRVLRSSTLRDVSRSKSMRSASEDISYVAYDKDSGDSSIRRQSRRGGSAESPLIIGRSVLSEGLRAAGIMKRPTAEDVFRELREAEASRSPRSSAGGGGGSISNGELNESPDSGRSRIQIEDSSSPSTVHSDDIDSSYDPRTPASGSIRLQSLSRPATSMARSYYDESSEDYRVPILRTNKTSAPVTNRDRDLIAQASTSRNGPPGTPQDRMYSSPYGIQRQFTGTPLSAHRDWVDQGEHGRLMLDSLSIFESHLSRLPPMGNTTTSTIPELFQSAQHIVQATEQVNTLLRNGTNKALEEQVAAEVSGDLGEGNPEMSEYWKSVGASFRDSLRVSDHLVRGMTGFLLGVGKVLRDTSSSMSSQQQHMRSIGLDDGSPDVAHSSGGRSSEGRRSAAGSRRSWDPVRRDTEYRAPSREGSFSNRPPSSFRDRRTEETPPTTTTTESSVSGRRLLISRDRDSVVNTHSPSTLSRRALMDFQESLALNEPSPTPASRQQTLTKRTSLPPLDVHRPLPSPPGPMNRQASDSDPSHRKKMSTNSAVTVRAGEGFQPAVTSPSATTAITAHTVSLNRSNSTPGSGFSKPSQVSVSALNGVKHRETRSRLASSSFSSADEQSPPSAPASTNVHTKISLLNLSDREREARWRTVGSRTVRTSADVDRGQEPRTTRVPSAQRERRRTINEVFAGG